MTVDEIKIDFRKKNEPILLSALVEIANQLSNLVVEKKLVYLHIKTIEFVEEGE